eukprot:2980229-Amphidinium_carterae.1
MVGVLFWSLLALKAAQLRGEVEQLVQQARVLLHGEHRARLPPSRLLKKVRVTRNNGSHRHPILLSVSSLCIEEVGAGVFVHIRPSNPRHAARDQ